MLPNNFNYLNKAIMKNIGLGYSSLSDRIFIGKQKVKNGTGIFVGEKRDYTNEFLHTVEQYFKIGTSREITKGKKESLFIHIENTADARRKLVKSLIKELEEHKNILHN